VCHPFKKNKMQAFSMENSWIGYAIFQGILLFGSLIHYFPTNNDGTGHKKPGWPLGGNFMALSTFFSRGNPSNLIRNITKTS
jgi:hypothetical protein